jgi:transcriptional regulator with XRE-family HTH domain
MPVTVGHMTPANPEAQERIVELWLQDWTLAAIGEELGVSRQRVSQRLIEAGYSPAQRRAERIAARDLDATAYRLQRTTSVARRAEQRDERITQLIAIADELGVRVLTLGQYATRSGAYSIRAKGDGQRLGKGTLPQRDSPEGVKLARRVRDVAAPWSAMHLSQIASRRPR